MAAKIVAEDWKNKPISEILERGLPSELLISEINPQVELENEK